MCRSRNCNSAKSRFGRPPVTVLEELVLQNHARKLFVCCAVTAMLLMPAHVKFVHAQSSATLAERTQKVMNRPEFAHANFGIKFVSLDTGKVLYSLNSNKLFVPASTTKLLTEGTVAFVDEDHSYNGPAVDGDPLVVIKQLASDVAAKGVRKIEGRILVDTGLFLDGPREGGTNVVLSSIMVNDNVIDLLLTPGAKSGDPAAFISTPQTSYIKFVSRVTTAPATSKSAIDISDPFTNPDGTVSAIVTGSVPLGSQPTTAAFAVPSPTTFAQTVLAEALSSAGVSIKPPKHPAAPDFPTLARQYTPANQVAEHVSLPLAEEIKVTLKVSQNLHAGMGPYLLGTLVAKNS